MIDQNVKVAVATPDREGVYKTLSDMGVDVISLPYMFNALPKRTRGWVAWPVRKILNYYSILGLIRFCRNRKPDMIHSNTSVNDVGYHTAKFLKIPHIWHIREYGDKDFDLTIPHIDRRLLAKNNYSIAITRDIASYRKVVGISSNRVIYNGIIDKSDVSSLKSRDKYFLFAGRIEPAKGVDDCVKAFLELKRKDYKLLIAGKETPVGKGMMHELKKDIESAGMNNNVEWLGERSDVKELMRNSTAVVVPSKFEGFGRVMPEAMSVGAIVIGRDTGGIHEQFCNGLEHTGKEIGFRFTDVNSLVERMRQVIDAPAEMLDAIRINAGKTVTALYTNNAYGSAVLQFYKDICL